MARLSTCKYCGKLMLWARRRDNGKAIILNPSAPVWRIVGHDDDGTPVVALCQQVDGERSAMLGHHHDCDAYHRQQAADQARRRGRV